MVLLIDAAQRPESRTRKLARKAARMISEETEVLNLYEHQVAPLTYEMLLKREDCISRQDYSDGMFDFAKQFREAETIVIAAPFWDLSFPSILKCYFEAIAVRGLTFQYNEAGIPVGLCNAKKLIYVTTAGGYIPEENHGFGYVKQICGMFFGISEIVCVKAEGLDIFGADTERILDQAEQEMYRKIGAGPAHQKN